MGLQIVILVSAFLVLLLLGVPIAFALGAPGLLYLAMSGGTVPIVNLAHSMTTLPTCSLRFRRSCSPGG